MLPDGVDAVRAFAAATGVGVFNTFGLKGIFRWDDPAHLGTIGLQARDVELAGILEAGVVLGVGLDPLELGPDDLGPRVEVVAPARLADWVGRVEPAPRGRLYDALRSALLPLYDSDAVPLTPAAALADLSALLPPGGLVCADAGVVGLWVARTFTTVELGSVYVPSVDDPSLAPGRARAAAARGRPTVYVTARDVGTIPGVVVERWTAAGALGSRRERRERLRALLDDGGSATVETPVDLTCTQVLLDVAGPVSAWRRPRRGPAPQL